MCEGDEIGLAWLVAPLLEHTKIRKFSGTLQAGLNGDFMGETCDALAHYSLHDSNNELVFADMQGELHCSYLLNHAHCACL